MGKTTATALAAALGGVSLSQTNLDLFYDELETELAHMPVVVWVDTIQGVLGQNSYSAGGAAGKIWMVFWGGKQLSPAGLKELEALGGAGGNWRGVANGTPVAFSLEGEAEGTFLLYPPPSAGSGAVATFPTGLGASFQANQISLLVSRIDLELPDWLDGFAGLSLLARELKRDSAQRDEEAAGFAEQLRDIFQILSLGK